MPRLKILPCFRPLDLFRLLHGVIMRQMSLLLLMTCLASHALINGQDKPKTNSEQAKDIASPTEEKQTVVQVNATTPREAQSSEAAKNKSNNEPKPFMTHGEWIISGITSIYVLIAYLTLMAIRKSSERQLRAYVVCELGSIVNIADPIKPTSGELIPTEAARKFPWGPIGRVQIMNTGQTPAFKVEHWGNMCLREYPLTSPLPERAKGLLKSISTIGPGIRNTKTLSIGPVLTDDEVARLRNATAAIYFYGEIIYEDAFKKRHSTRYRLIHNQGAGPVGISTDFTFTEEGNEAD
jgi:hypothetical protein